MPHSIKPLRTPNTDWRHDAYLYFNSIAIARRGFVDIRHDNVAIPLLQQSTVLVNAAKFQPIRLFIQLSPSATKVSWNEQIFNRQNEVTPKTWK